MWQLSIICVAFSATYARHVTNNLEPSPSDVQIIGGYDIDISEAPYQVSIMGMYPEVKNHWEQDCGGSIIAKDIILTAAHCLYGLTPLDIQVRVGSTYWKSGGLIVPVANLTYNSNFSYAKLDYDVGLVKLSTPLEFSDTVKPIAMINDGEEIDDGAITNVTGWGIISENGTDPSTILQKVSVQKVNHQDCRSAYIGFDVQVTPRMLCTGVPGGGKNPCHGDSGGPLVHNEKVVGVVSWGSPWGCGEAKYPAVYAKVSALRSWIDENIKILAGEHGSDH